MESVIIDNRMEIKIAMSVCEVIFSYFCANTATPAPTGNADITSETIIHSGSMLNTYIIKMNVISGWNNNFKITIMAISDPLNVFFLVFENWPTKPNPIAKSAVAPEAFDSSSERVEIAVGSGIPNTATLIPKITEIVRQKFYRVSLVFLTRCYAKPSMLEYVESYQVVHSSYLKYAHILTVLLQNQSCLDLVLLQKC